MSSIYNSKYADEYENNKYIWENEADKNSEAARNAHKRNEEIRAETGVMADTMDYQGFKTARANHSDYYDMAKNVKVDPKYKIESDRLYDSINNFSYDAENDPAFTAYEKAAKRQMESAQKDTYANMTKASGGRNNSYAAAATAQVGQAYAAKIGDYASQLANQAYNSLVEKYKLSKERYKQATEEAEAEYNKYVELGNKDVETKRNMLEDQRKVEEHNQKMLEDKLNYQVKLDNFKTQLIENKILNEKNLFEFEKWKADPYYKIKDETLAKVIGEYMAFTWAKENAGDFFYSSLY